MLEWLGRFHTPVCPSPPELFAHPEHCNKFWQIVVSAEPIEKPKLILPQADELDLRDVEWIILVKDNWEEQWEKLQESGDALAFFSVSDKGYENLGLNYSDLRAFIQQQDAIIAAYRGYYLEAEQEFNEANGLDKEE